VIGAVQTHEPNWPFHCVFSVHGRPIIAPYANAKPEGTFGGVYGVTGRRSMNIRRTISTQARLVLRMT
jgi:hypothetical protein